MVRCAKSITGALVVGVLVNLLQPGLVQMRMGVLGAVMWVWVCSCSTCSCS